MAQNHLLISINILTWNGEKYISDCLKSALGQTYPKKEITVIDNNSSDRTVEIASKFNVKMVLNNEQVGFAAGHNQAIRQSGGELILCLNQDVVLDRDFVYYAVKAFNEETASVQGKVFRFDKNGSLSKKIDTTGLVMLKNRRIINRGQGKEEQFNQKEEIFGADGACPVYRKKALEDVKIYDEYFDEDFFAYKEDVDLAWRLRLAGWKNVYQPEARACHWRGSGDSAVRTPWGIIKERRKLNKFSKYLAFKNQRLMQLKNEEIGNLIRHLPWILSKELGAWVYVLCFEQYTWPAIKDLFKQAPRAWKKRKVIMAKKRKSLKKWFM